MNDDLDLSALGSGPVLALAPVAAIRARGEQRRHRGRAVLASAAALLLVASAGTAVALSSTNKPDALQTADPTGTPAPPPLNPAAYLLTPQDAARVAGGTWDPGSPQGDQGLLLHICPEGEGWTAPGISRYLQRDNDGVWNLVAALDPAEPQRWVETFRDAAGTCPRRAADSEDGRASNSFVVLTGASVKDAVVLRDTYRDCDTCPASVTIWLVVASDRLLSVASVGQHEEQHVGQWLDVMRARLGNPDPNPPSPTASPSYEQPAPDGELSFDDLLQIDRIGPVRVGMTLDQTRAAAGQELRQEGDLIGGCVFYAPRSKSPDVSFMVLDGIVSRIDVDEASTTTTQEGVRIGSTEADVKRTYPNATVSKHAYVDGHYLRVLADDGRTAYVFETDGVKVTSFRSGFPDAVDRVEGCA